MSFTISTNAPLTDYSGLLKEGMSRADLKQYEDVFCFKKLEKAYDKADIDKNNVLSRDEIVSELGNDLKSVKRSKWRHAVLAGIMFGACIATIGTGGAAAPILFGSLGVLNTTCVVDKFADQKAIEQILEEGS